MDTPRDFDVIIVGGGGSGLCAAIAAAECGRSVVVLEKNEICGGSTSWSVGSVTASRSRFQREQGIVDSPASHFEDMAKFHGRLTGRDNEDLRRVLTEGMPETFERLLALGLVFLGPMPEPPHSVPRMHNVLPHSRAFAHALAKRARKLGVSILTRHRAVRLLRSGHAVVGVEAEVEGKAKRYCARNSVVLAAGDFSASSELKRRYAGEDLSEIDPVNPTSTGDGHLIALDLGAEIVNGDIVTGPQLRFIRPQANLLSSLPPTRLVGRAIAVARRWLPAKAQRPFLMKFLTTVLEPQRSLFEAGAIMINRNGERFCDELVGPEFAIPRQPGKEAFIILDGALVSRFSKWPHYVSTAPGVAYAYVPDYRRGRRDIYREAGDIETLAEHLSIPASPLRATVAHYNRSPRSGTSGLHVPPFVALGPLKSVIPITEGGLRVDARMRVLSADGLPLPGLYAAGANGQGGLLLEGHGHHLGWAFTSGRLAGRSAAAFEAAASGQSQSHAHQHREHR